MYLTSFFVAREETVHDVWEALTEPEYVRDVVGDRELFYNLNKIYIASEKPVIENARKYGRAIARPERSAPRTRRERSGPGSTISRRSSPIERSTTGWPPGTTRTISVATVHTPP